MAFTKSQRIIILLVIDSIFFLVELISGYAVHSLALVADSFHMLNDIVSLFVGLWAVKQAKAGRSANYTYGWQRAETIGALFNGVFLIALCLSIFLDAIQRFVEPQIVTNPKLVLIVGCLGLASNLLGLLLFHEHGHDHGSGEDSHGGDAVKAAEEGRGHTHEAHETTALLSDERGSVEDTLPSVRVGGYQGTPKRKFSKSDESNSTAAGERSGHSKKKSVTETKHKRRASFFTGSIDNFPVHPAGRRDEILQAARFDDDESDANSDGAVDTDSAEASTNNTSGKSADYGTNGKGASVHDSHAAHKHRQPRDQTQSSGGHGHSHGDLNMRGVFLHVMGDALGNIGVIITALIIWLTTFPGRYYFDPGVSLVITCIILWSAIPLCKAASRILLQAVPMGLSVDEIRTDIESLDGVVSAHHLHVWQLTDTKIVASLHVKISHEIKNTGTEGYMRLAREIQQCLKEYGIRSSTIQPEFETVEDCTEHDDHHDGVASPKRVGHKTSSLGSKDSDACLLDSEDAGGAASGKKGHDHDHDHDHDEHDGHDHGNGKKHNHQH